MSPNPNRLPCGRPKPLKPKGRSGDEEAWKEKLDRYLTSNALNQSESRNKLFEIIFRQHGHFTVQSLIKFLNEACPHIGAATVYRNIPLFLDAGLLKETLTDDTGSKIYEVSEDDHHDHIVCVDCNQIFEFHDSRIEKAQDRVVDELGFAQVRHRHVIFGKCQFASRP